MDCRTASAGTANTSVGVARNDKRDAGPRREQPGSQRVDGDRNTHVGGAVGVDVVAHDEGAVQPTQPLPDRGRLGQQVDPGPGEVLLRSSRRDGQHQRPRPVPGRRQDPRPDLRVRQVHRRDPCPPAQQRLQGSHLGTGAQHGDGEPVGPEPRRVGHHGAHRLRGGGLDHAGRHPRVELAVERVAAQPGAAVRQRQLALDVPLASDLGGDQLRRRAPVGESQLLPLVARHPHPGVQ